MREVAPVEIPELSEAAFGILQTAVAQACERQIKSVQALRERLNSLYPDCQAHIEQAIAYWSASVRHRGTPD